MKLPHWLVPVLMLGYAGFTFGISLAEYVKALRRARARRRGCHG